MSDTMCWALRRGNPATVEIYDSPEPGRTAKELQAALAVLHPKRLLITINSAAGTFAQGLDLYDVLAHGSGEIKTLVQFAANGGALVAMAAPGGNRFITADGSLFILAPTFSRVEARAPLLERLQTETYEAAVIFSGAMGGDTEFWRSAMESGTLYTSEHAVCSVSTLPELQKWTPAVPEAHWKRREPQITGELRIAADAVPKVVTW